MLELRKGDYISFDDDFRVLYKVLDFDSNYVLYYDNEYGYSVYEKIDYITKIFRFYDSEIQIWY